MELDYKAIGKRIKIARIIVKKEYILIGSVLTCEVVSMFLIAYLYQILDSHLIKIIIQNVANVLSICVTLLAIKVSKKSLRDFGLSTDHLFKQILIGLVVGFILVVLLQGLSFLEASPNLYDIFSMMLVGFSEELLFRGFLFTMIYELSGSRLKAVFIPSIVFGIWHFPVGQSIDQVIGTTIIGLIYSGMRSLYFRTDKEIGIIPLSIFHWMHNIFIL